jgi:hypothetical protein
MTQVAAAPKQALVFRIEAIAVACSDCGGTCENAQGSTMIEDGDNIVSCLSCGGRYAVPASAFKVKTSRTTHPAKSIRRLNLDLTELKNALSHLGGYTLNEQVRALLRFNGDTTHPCSTEIVKEITPMPVLNTRYGILVGHFTDVAPWDDCRHTWEVRVNGCFNSAMPGKPFYEFWVRVVK